MFSDFNASTLKMQEKEKEAPVRAPRPEPSVRRSIPAVPPTGVRTLEKKNKQLSNATKELEEKMKSLRMRTQQRALPKVRSRLK